MSFRISVAIFLLLQLCMGCGGGASGAEAEAWKAARSQGNEAALEAFLSEYPQSGYRAEAERLLDGMLWSFAEQEQTVYHYRYYAKRFPAGKHVAEVEAKINALPKTQPDFAELTSRTYSGVIRSGKEDIQVISLRFSQIEQNEQTIQFVADINAGNNLRKTVPGRIAASDNAITFEEDPSDAVLFGLSQGRIYNQNSRILLQSTDPNVFWSMK